MSERKHVSYAATAEQLAAMLRQVVDAYCADVHLGSQVGLIQEASAMLKDWDGEGEGEGEA